MSNETRRPFVAGNWKMNLDRRGAVDLAGALRRFVESQAKGALDVAVFPPSVYLGEVAKTLESSPVRVGSQNLHFEPKGAFTGEVSAVMVRDVGATMTILGHSERRHVFHEPDEWIARKLRAALAAGLDPILCVGETLEEREARRTLAVIERQFASAIEGLSPKDLPRVTVAYEPVWAIGTGRNATPAQAGEVHREIRRLARAVGGEDFAAGLRIQYGGSVTPENATALFAEPEIDGFLVGGASLDAGKFQKIVEAGLRRTASRH